MDHSVHNKIVSFIWSIADDCLRDVFVRGKYRDVIQPMFVLRRLDCLLEPSKEAVLEEVRFQREDAHLCNLDWPVKKGWILPHPAYPTSVAQNFTSALNPPSVAKKLSAIFM